MFTHPCIKCGQNYQDSDPEPFYCTPCNNARKAIAKQIDAKARTSKNVKSAIQEYDETPKVHGFIHVKL